MSRTQQLVMLLHPAGGRIPLAQEHLGAGVLGADAVQPDQASAGLAIVDAKFTEFETPCTWSSHCGMLFVKFKIKDRIH